MKGELFMLSFEQTGLNNELIQAVTELGFENPTAIQEQTIPHLLVSGSDLIGLAQTGTGKTAAFGLPIIQQIDIDAFETQSLILCPTRELCMQITKDLKSFSKYTKGISVIAVYGGTSIETQIQSLKRGKHIVVGTPGRVLDLIRRNKLHLSSVRWLVLDEADEMLSMGFKEDLNLILDETPKERQTLLFSATMSREIKAITTKYMKKPEEITIGTKNTGAELVNHQYYLVQAKDRYEALKRLADIHPDIYGIVFCRTKVETQEVAEKLIQDGYNADALHGDLSQIMRDQVMNRFRTKHLQILVATDVAARGLDVSDLTHIINYNLPDELSLYIHRSGRTGRAGKTGISITIIHTRERHKIKSLENMIGKKFEQKQVPGGKDICEKQLFNVIDGIEKVEVNEKQIEQYLPNIYKKLAWLSREDLIQRFVSVEFNRFLEYYKNAPDLNVQPYSSSSSSDSDRREKRGRGRERLSYSRFFVNLGSQQNINASRIIGIINERLNTSNVAIGKIEIMKKFSFVEIDSQFEEDVVEAFTNKKFGTSSVVLELVRNPLKEERSSSYSKPSNGRESERSFTKSRSRRNEFQTDDKRRKRRK
jgi:ATP-dependent RNA helicase DeaD